MRLPNDEILMHGPLPYDPVKAHEYYMRTRQLKGRKRGGQPPPTNLRSRPAADGPTRARQRAAAAARVKSLQSKLTQLHKALKEAMAKEAKAKKRSKEAAKPDTAAEKSKKARESKKYRDTHKQELKSKAKKAAAKSGGGSGGSKSGSATKSTKQSGGSSVKEIRTAIKGVQKALAAAKARQRALG